MIKIYEVGTYEQYEEGFHAFYRTQDECKALKVLELAQTYLKNAPHELGPHHSDEEFRIFKDQCRKLDLDFQRESKAKDFSISRYFYDLYTIEIRSFETND
ncbi:hypothetical protein B9T31_14905 [Acinetobacter sp. ANC 4558]|uniref:hypothetical protein n=1 Tax=Acinetobacter sp. ANC 4558 TaxID=1977876 RepID=UPI000A35BB90|nr:hypothetical protein [Acinetobacter sp. ANC 4558]OTG81811.1 hypothetical protein B9T31_14905 [Acinetobacter sp. ANC 4558]